MSAASGQPQQNDRTLRYLDRLAIMGDMKQSILSRLSLPSQLILFLACTMPLLWGFIAFDLNRLHQSISTNSRIHTQNLARAFAEEVKSSVNAVDYALIDLRDQWFNKSVDFDELVRRRQGHLEHDVGFQVAILDANGTLVFSNVNPQAKGQNFSDREHFQVHRERADDELFISRPLLGRVSKRWTIQFTRPLKDAGGRFAGVIVLSVSPDYFSRFHQTIDLGRDGTIGLARTTGEILIRSPDPESSIGKSLDGTLLYASRAADSGVLARVSEFDGIKRLYGWRVLPKGDLFVFLGESLDTIFAPYHRQRQAYLIGGAVISFFIAFIGYFFLAGQRKRRQHEHALQESVVRLAAEQQRIKVILENSHDAFVAIDPNGRITDWNNKAERIFGWSASEAVGKDLGELIIPAEQRAMHNAGFRRFVATGTSTIINNVIEVEALDRHGCRLPVELAVAGFRDDNGYTVTAFIRDITPRKEAERREAERMQTLDETRAALQHAQKLEAVGKLTGGVAHDFNNVLQIIGGNLQLMQMQSEGNKEFDMRLESMLSAVDRGAKLSSHLLAFARRQPLRPQVINLRRIVEGMHELLQQAVGESVQIKRISPDGLWNTVVDASQLENVILNLALNARDAMEGRGTLTIELDNVCIDHPLVLRRAVVPTGEYVMLAISDTGVGMSVEVMEHAFEPFFTTKPHGQGTGLGLSMAYGFVNQSDGQIDVESKVDDGTTFRIYLPRSTEPEIDIPLVSSDAPIRGCESILVVEDDLHVEATVVATLRELGYQVLRANDADSALEIIKSGVPIDLLFTDIVMPGALRGSDLAKEAKRLVPDLPVLFTSGYTQNAIERGGKLDPDIHLLSKPYRREQLAQAIAHLLRKAK